MHVDKQTIKLWSINEVSTFLERKGINFKVQRGFQEGLDDVPIFILEGLKK